MTPTSKNEPAEKRTPFNRVLIANRGEVALRIMRSARVLGYQTVAVHSSVDANARHVQQADMSVCIGAAAPQASYLNIAAIIDAARKTGADAVHPGYGFLSENAAFAAACRDAGLVFIGPAPAAIALMGDKALAKARMMEAGVPCIPGYGGEAQDDVHLEAQAQRIGFPIMIKARAGGGGRGMRIALQPKEFRPMLQVARSEARAAFGDDAVLLERALLRPRHVEIQVVADRHGKVIHLGDRDCSVQRRHQKLIEEAPSPAVSAQLREQMGRVAVQATQAVGYEGVGTLEFLLDAQGDFWFMEMNTRLQVEHCVTEAITGLDLVEMQLRIAEGEPLEIEQESVRFHGHSIQARLCAEEPGEDFAPRSGQVLLWRAPAASRVDTAMADGADIPPDYDSLIAKLVVHGMTRDEARRKLAAALDTTVLLGVATNRQFLANCIRHPVFAAGDATTSFIEDEKAQLVPTPGKAQARLYAVAALLMLVGSRLGTADARDALGHLQHRKHILMLQLNGLRKSIVINVLSANTATVLVDDTEFLLRVSRITAHALRVDCEGIEQTAFFARADNALWIQFAGMTVEALDVSRAVAAGAFTSGVRDARVVAGMNGRIAQIWAQPGDIVAAGQQLFSIEAMKMEHMYNAPASGRLAVLKAVQGQLVKTGETLAEIEQQT